MTEQEAIEKARQYNTILLTPKHLLTKDFVIKCIELVNLYDIESAGIKIDYDIALAYELKRGIQFYGVHDNFLHIRYAHRLSKDQLAKLKTSLRLISS